MPETEAEAKLSVEVEPSVPLRVIDNRSITAIAAVVSRMGRTHGLPAKDSYHFWEDEDKTPEGIVIVYRERKQVNRNMNMFMESAEWWAPTHLLPLGSDPRPLRVEVVPEGVKVTHFLHFYGTTIIGLPGMPKGQNTIYPKVQYLTAPNEEKFIDMIFDSLNQK